LTFVLFSGSGRIMKKRVLKKRRVTTLLLAAFLALGVSAGLAEAAAADYDLVIPDGRVMEHESGLEAVRQIGTNGDKIAPISEKPIKDRETVDKSRPVAAPGFINHEVHSFLMLLSGTMMILLAMIIITVVYLLLSDIRLEKILLHRLRRFFHRCAQITRGFVVYRLSK